MKSSALRQISLYALSLGIAACGAGDGSAPALPTAPEVVRPSGVAAPDSSTEIWMPVGFEGAEPPNFKAVFRVRPKPDTEGIIRGESPLTVEFDVCSSRTDTDKTLTYLYDWDFDHRPNVVGTGDACRQEHTYNLQRLPFSRGNVYETNVCVVSGNPRVHGPGTYFSCRTFTINLPAPSPVPSPVTSSCGPNDVSFDGHCYYLDGSQGVCDAGYALASQSVLTSIAPLFEGLNYKHTVSDNCCIYNSEPDEDWGMESSCNSPGPFQAGEPVLNGADCTDSTNFLPNQLTLCGSVP